MARKITTAKVGPLKKTQPAPAPTEAARPTRASARQGSKAAAAPVAPIAPSRARASTRLKAAPPPPPPKPVTVTLKHLAAGLSERRGLPKRDSEAFATDLIGALLEQVKAGAKVRIAGLGVIEIKDRPARTARNPATGAPVQVEASRKVVFRVAKDLKDAI